MPDIEGLAERIVARVLSEQGITKSAGGMNRGDLLPMAFAVAGGMAVLEEEISERNRLMRAQLKAQRKMVRRLGEQAGMLAGVRVPGIPEVAKRVVDLDLERFGVQLAGRNLPEDGGPWYPGHSVDPENDGN